MKIIDRLIRVALYAMIALSLFLSWKIWTNSGSQAVVQNSSTGESNQTLKQPKDVFLPTQLVYHAEKDDFNYSNKESLINNVTKELFALDWTKASPFKVNKDPLKDLFLSNQDSVELGMPAALTIDYFLEINHQGDLKKFAADKLFNRIVISFENKVIYFIDDKAGTGYQITFKESLSSIQKLVEAEDNRYFKVKYHENTSSLKYYVEEELKLKKYSYILGMQSYTVFSQAFFESGQEVIFNDGDENSKDVNLSNEDGGNLTVKYSTGEVRFNGRMELNEKVADEPSNIFSDTYYYVQKLAGTMGTVRYFEGNQNHIVYRNFVEGYPIFSGYTKGRLEIDQQNNNIQIVTNQETIQVPIPSEEEVTLKNTEETLNQLQKSGLDLTKIEGLQIGYTWVVNEETKQVIDLVPEWYVKLGGTWDSVPEVRTWLQQKAGGA